MLKNKEELIKQNIQEVINSWDPIGLMNICPEDEYEPEINKIVEFVICNKNINKISLSEEIRKILASFVKKSNFYNEQVWYQVEVSDRMIQLANLAKKTEKTKLELNNVNARALYLAYPQFLSKVDRWGR